MKKGEDLISNQEVGHETGHVHKARHGWSRTTLASTPAAMQANGIDDPSAAAMRDTKGKVHKMTKTCIEMPIP
jgi:hypothetical protein